MSLLYMFRLAARLLSDGTSLDDIRYRLGFDYPSATRSSIEATIQRARILVRQAPQVTRLADEMADAIKDWNVAKAEREAWRPKFIGDLPPTHFLEDAQKINARLSRALAQYEIFKREYIDEAS